MVSNKLLRCLKINKRYLIYDSIYEYILVRTNYGYSIYREGFPNNSLLVIEKDLEDLILESVDTNFYKGTYIYKGHTNKYKAVSSIGFISVHGYFNWRDLYFFGESKKETDVKDLRRFEKVMKYSSRKTKKVKL